MKRLFKISFLMLLVLWPIFGFPTCIVIFKDSKSFYIAADSKAIYGPGIPPSKICKIHRWDKITFAMSGHGDNIVTSVVVNILSKHKSMVRSLAMVGDSMCKVFNRVMNDPRQTQKWEFVYYQHNALADVAFIYPSGDSLDLKEIEFVMKVYNGKAQVSYVISPSLSHTTLGLRQEIDDPNNNDVIKLRLSRTSPENLALGLVKLEQQYHPDQIGEPYDVVRLNPDGTFQFYTPVRCP